MQRREIPTRTLHAVCAGLLIATIALAASAVVPIPAWLVGVVGIGAACASTWLLLQARQETDGAAKRVPALSPAEAPGALPASIETRVEELEERLRKETAARRKAEHQLSHIQKMEAVSHLASGIAHDLNNKLVVVGANVDAVVKHLKEQPRLRRRLLAALVASDQAAALMSKLLAFARLRELRPQYLSLPTHITSCAELLERSFVSSSVRVEVDLPEELWPVEADPDEFEATLVNLALNARDAMPEGGVLTVSARNTKVWEGRVRGLAPGDYVEVSVHDTGGGIAPENLSRVFEPFFTTKQESNASGLGLSQVRAFVNRLGGGADITTETGKGTRVSIFLPKAQLSAQLAGADGPEDFVDDEEAVVPSAEILLVDDEVEVALAMQGMLEHLGYETRVAIGPDEAMEALRARRPSLVLTDVTMPGSMSGLDLGREIRRRYPDLPVILITGNPRVLGERNDFPMVQKPIVSRDLHAAIQRQLAPAAQSSNVVPLPLERRRQGS